MREGYGTCSVINPRRMREGYGTWFVIRVHRAAENSDHFYALVKLWHDKHRNGLQFDSWILLKCFHSRVMADSP